MKLTIENTNKYLAHSNEEGFYLNINFSLDSNFESSNFINQ